MRNLIVTFVEKSVLTNYLKSGVGSFKTLDGECTLVILSEEQTLIYRDRHGAGSHINGIDTFYTLCLGNFITIKGSERKPNSEAIHPFISIGYIPSPMASLMDVQKLPAGNVQLVKYDEIKFESLLRWEDDNAACLNPQNISADATAKYEELHQKAIKQREEGKNWVGLLVSGEYAYGRHIAGLRVEYASEALSYSIGYYYKQVKAFHFFNLLVVSVWWVLFIYQKNSSNIKMIINR